MSLSISDLNINSVSRLPTSETLAYIPIKKGTEFTQISTVRTEQRDIGPITFTETYDRHVLLTYETNPPNIVLSAGNVNVQLSGVEVKIDTTNSKLDTLITQTDTVEPSLVTSVNVLCACNNKLTALELMSYITALAVIETNIDDTNAKLAALTAALLPTSTSTVYVCAAVTAPTAITLLAANATRRGMMIHNETDGVLYVKLGSTPTTSSFSIRLPVLASYEMPLNYYSGIVTGIWNTAGVPTGNVYITELY